MPTLHTLVGRTLRAVGTMSPTLAGRLALRSFFVTTPRTPVRDADVDTHHSALRTRLAVHGRELVVHEWGTGRETVLVLHGWRGRASQLAPLVRELVAEGFHVVSFDAPAHGDSPGARADIRDWVAAAESLERLHGPFRAIVGHSLGSLAALTVARTSVRTGRVAVVSGVGGPDAFLTEFARELHLDHATRTQLEARFHDRLGEDRASMAARYDAVAHPLPAGTELLVVHDRGDRRMPDHDALRLHAAHAGRSTMVRTSGSGHTSVLSADVALDALTAFVRGGLAAVDDLHVDASETGAPASPVRTAAG
ncbi:alpha/beta fold hydrolase [Oerskovia sp. NPDC057915]|uniref:alpha/beta fold hydrolase n=1 Tax=Oerskovia sp. NPDC057915 TaxID=3346280 RepID=UPI0036DD86DB